MKIEEWRRQFGCDPTSRRIREIGNWILDLHFKELLLARFLEGVVFIGAKTYISSKKSEIENSISRFIKHADFIDN